MMIFHFECERGCLIMMNLRNQAFPMRYAKNLAKPYAFCALQKQIKQCTKCEHCRKTEELTLWGSSNATLLVILSWPDMSLNETALLKNVFDFYKVDPDILAFTYAYHCNAYSSHHIRPPFRQEIENCVAYTHQAIDIIEPLAILCLSSISSNLFYRQSLSDSIKEPTFIQNIPIFTTYPPSYILNLYNSKNSLYESKNIEFYTNIKRALDYLEEKYPKLAIYKES